jgi:hypothetical protein
MRILELIRPLPGRNLATEYIRLNTSSLTPSMRLSPVLHLSYPLVRISR